MRRNLVLTLMLIAMLWQSVALARVGSTVNPLADPAHALLHWLNVGHHHHDDGSYQVDESKESTHHVAIDHSGATLAVATATSHAFPPGGLSAPGAVREAPVPHPVLDGLLRPPRFRS
jgi:hypothetical protein